MIEKNTEVKRSRAIDSKVKLLLWGTAAGRCEFQGCNKELYTNPITKEQGNYAENAHIQAVSPNGARYFELMDEGELNSFENLMLLCPTCHKNIDEHPDEYPKELLREIKRRHEDRIRKVTAEDGIMHSLMISYFANIADVTPLYNDALFRYAITNNGLVPSEKYSIQIGIHADELNDGSEEYYKIQEQHLERSFNKKVINTIDKNEHLSIFALAPQPLLIKLGVLLSDISNVSVFQCHREGPKWAWRNTISTVNYQLTKESALVENEYVVLNISLSADISKERIEKVTGKDQTTYKITISNPNRNFVATECIADNFVKFYRNTTEIIKQENPNANRILLFPAMPNSLAIRLGMDYMPKVDLPITIFDQINGNLGFVETITIGGTK